MRNRTKQQMDQRSLFQPLNPAVSWDRLPSEIQQQTVRLLARLLRQHGTRNQDRLPIKETNNE